MLDILCLKWIFNTNSIKFRSSNFQFVYFCRPCKKLKRSATCPRQKGQHRSGKGLGKIFLKFKELKLLSLWGKGYVCHRLSAYLAIVVFPVNLELSGDVVLIFLLAHKLHRDRAWHRTYKHNMTLHDFIYTYSKAFNQWKA